MEYWLFAAGIAVLVWTWLLVRKGYAAGWAKLDESRQRLEQQATDLAVVAEEVLSDLSERTERLRQLIAQADAVLARVETTAAPPVVTNHAPKSVAEIERVPPAVALLSALEAAAAEVETVTPPPVSPAPNRSAAARPAGHQLVWELAEQGESVPEIARQLQKTQGEVELILGLRRLG